MEKSHFSLTWEKFHSSMCAGFSLLQQDGELVDLTLAADGHLVKVHQIVISIASPYLKSLILSANCKHPVIFLHNISYTVLQSILEYVYTGEVSIDERNMNAFFEAAKNLQIRGLDDETSPIVRNCRDMKSTLSESINAMPVKSFKLETMSNDAITVTEDIPLPSTARNVSLKRKMSQHTLEEQHERANNIQSDSANFDDILNQDDGDNWSDGLSSTIEDVTFTKANVNIVQKRNKRMEKKDKNIMQTGSAEMKFTLSNRGSLQLILNRYMYNLKNYQRRHGSLRRWYCVDQRHLHCPALVVTQDNIVVQRAKLHNHPFHDRRILGKVERKAVYTAIQAAQDTNKDA